MAQESRLAIVIDSRNAEDQAQDLKKALELLDEAGIRVTSSTSRAGKSTADAGKAFSQAGKEAKDASNKVSDLDKSLKNTEAMAANLTRSLKYAFAGFSTMALIDAADDWGQYASRMKQATNSTEEYDHAQRRMAQSAKDTYRSINETRESFIQMSPVLRDMGLSLDQSIDAIDTFSGLLVVNSASAERGAAAMEALAKSMQKGKIDADAWISIYSTVDSVVEIIAESSGMAAEEIRKLGAEGKLSIDALVKALVDGNAEVKAQVEAMPTTVRDALQNLQNGFQEWIGINNEATGVTATLASGINVLGDNFESVANVLTGVVAAGLSLYAVRAALAAREAAALALASRGVAAVFTTAGGLATLVGVATTAFMMFASSTKSASAAMLDMGDPIDQLIDKFEKLGTLQRSVQLDLMAAEQKSQIKEAHLALTDFVDEIEPTTAKGVKAVAEMRSAMKGEIQGIVSDVSLSSDQMQEAINDLINKWAEQNNWSDEVVSSYRSLAVALVDAQTKVNQTSSAINELTLKHEALSASAKGTSQALQQMTQPGMKEWDKYLKKLTDARDLIGLNARELGEMRAAQAGANAEQAKMAGIIEAQSAEYKKLQTAIQDKDKAAAEAAKKALRDLELERQRVALLAAEMRALGQILIDIQNGKLSSSLGAMAQDMAKSSYAIARYSVSDTSDVDKRIDQIGVNTIPTSGGGGGGKSKAQQEREEYKDRLDALNDFIASQQELELNAHIQRMADLDKIKSLGLVSDERYGALSLGIQQKHIEEMALIEFEQMNSKFDKTREMHELGLISDEEYMMSMWAARMSHEEAMTQLLNDKHLERIEALNAQREEGALSDEEYYLLKQEAEMSHQDMLTKLAEEGAINRAKAEQDLTNKLNGMRQNAFDMGVNLLNMFAGKSRAAAIAAIVLQKGLAIAQTITSTAAAQMRAMAELGPIGGPPMAAKIGVMGKIQIGLIAATGIAQVASSGSSGGGGIERATSSGYGSSRQDAVKEKIEPPKTNTVVTINMTGETYSKKQVRELIEHINDAVSDGATLRLA